MGPFEELCYADNWVWDSTNKSPEVELSSNAHAAYFHISPWVESKGTAGVRGTKSFANGEHYWEISFLEPAWGTSMMIGVGTRQALLHTGNYQFVNLIGLDAQSWGLSYKGRTWHNGHSEQYCQPFYDQTTVIGVYLNLYKGTLTFYKNGEPLGVAFHDIPQGVELYPIISSTAESTEMEVTRRACRYLSLAEMCLFTVAQSLTKATDAKQLPLPTLLKEHVLMLKA